jgi:pseudaminic acid cytidylyltransferase
MKALAIITARGGSKRIPFKNIRNFHGKPIIAYSIKAAIEAGCFQEVMVSTDDEKISEIAMEYGAAVPFLRSEKNSNDFATTAEVLIEVVSEYRKRGQDFDFICCIYPTAPFVTASKLLAAYQMLLKSDADSLLPVTKFGFPIWRSLKKENDKVQFNWPEYALTRSQDLPSAFHDCGQFYFVRTAFFLEHGKLISENTLGMEVPESEVQDIDTEEDWMIAEIKYKMLNNNS